MQKHALEFILLIGAFLILPKIVSAAPVPVLNFSDITSGPKIGNTDGAGGLSSLQHGAIVTIWGNYLGSTQGSSKVYIGDVEAAHVYYWKDADGQLPGGPANLYAFHKMQEIAFSIPADAPDGDTTIKVVVNGVASTTLPFTVRNGHIYFIKQAGNDSTGDGSWALPWATMQNVTLGNNGKLSAGDIIYNVGVDAIDQVTRIGLNAGLVGSSDNPFSLIVYPNTRAYLSGGTSALLYQLFRPENDSKYWNFAKFSMETDDVSVGLNQGMRVIGNNITGPNVDGSGMSGSIGGNCTGAPDPYQCGGAKLYGNEIHHYGKSDGTTAIPQHLLYISNRSGTMIEAYEVAWNNLHDNPITHGIHIYDQGPQCGGWSGTLKIHHNVIKNNGGGSINLNDNCPELNNYEVHDNIVIQTPSYVSSGAGVPGAGLRIEGKGSYKIFNNTVYGYGGSNVFGSGGTIEARNNIIIDTKNQAYLALYGALSGGKGNNLLFSMANPSLAIPSILSGSLNVNPLFSDLSSDDFSLQSLSPAKAAGSDATISIAPADFFGQPRPLGSVSIGAIQYVAPAATSYSISDLTTLILNWLKTVTNSDINSDNMVNAKDLGIMMSKWQ